MVRSVGTLREDLRPALMPKGDPDPRPEKPALADAIRASKLPKRKPTEADAPPLSLFPMTPAAKAALELSGARKKRKRK